MAEDPFRLHFERSGGLAGTTVQADVDSTALPETEATQLRRLIDQVSLKAVAPSPRGADRFQYDITVERGGKTTSITAYDGSMPPAMKALTDWLTSFARRRQA